MIASRFTADQLVVSEINGGNKLAATKTIEIAKLLQHVYPEARFAVDGRHRDPSNEVDYRGRVDVFVSFDGPWAGMIDVDVRPNWNGGDRFTFQGPFVDKGEARYWGDGKVWRKDMVKLVEAIQKQNALRGQNPKELYTVAREELQKSACRRLSNLEEFAGKLLRLSREQSLALALGRGPSPELADLVKASESWQGLVARAQEDLDRQNAALAAEHGVEGWSASALNSNRYLNEVLRAL